MLLLQKVDQSLEFFRLHYQNLIITSCHVVDLFWRLEILNQIQLLVYFLCFVNVVFKIVDG